MRRLPERPDRFAGFKCGSKCSIGPPFALPESSDAELWTSNPTCVLPLAGRMIFLPQSRRDATRMDNQRAPAVRPPSNRSPVSRRASGIYPHTPWRLLHPDRQTTPFRNGTRGPLPALGVASRGSVQHTRALDLSAPLASGSRQIPLPDASPHRLGSPVGRGPNDSGRRPPGCGRSACRGRPGGYRAGPWDRGLHRGDSAAQPASRWCGNAGENEYYK